MTTCCLWKIITWLTYTQQGGVQVQILRRREYRGRADEHHKHAHPEPQRYPSFQLTLLFTGGRSVCPPEILVPRLSVTNRRALVHRCVSPTHGQLASESWHCCAGRRQAEGDWAWTHKMVSSSWAPPMLGAWEGILSWQGCPAWHWYAAGLLGLSTRGSSPEGFRWSVRWCYSRGKRPCLRERDNHSMIGRDRDNSMIL